MDQHSPSPAGRGFDALVLDGSTRQSLATVRSLGRAGLRVAVAESYTDCDPALPVLSFRSRHCARSWVLPDFAGTPEAYADAVVDIARAHPTPVVVPATDGSVAALLPRRARLAELGTALALPPDDAIAAAEDKNRTLDLARRLDIGVPRSVLVRTADEVEPVLAGFDHPVVLKPTRSWQAELQDRVNAVCLGGEAARRALHDFLDGGAEVLVQEWLGGRREGITLVLDDVRVLAAFAHVEHRTTPLLGGFSVLRESIVPPADTLRDAVALARGMGADGLCEVEFRRDLRGRPFLMEMNARLPGTTETAVRSGVDLPLMLWRRTAGLPVAPVERYRTGVRLRWLRGDLRWLRDCLQPAGPVDHPGRARAVTRFVTEFGRTGRYDVFDRRDLAPVLAEARITAAALHRGGRTAVGR